ncbi:M23 family metallopeptidase [Chromatocurvus halotolerans]|uniref:Peptidase M23-like protein n=1 Tax=Chromatocurvus halotolerans TaxID=1132028 RepID=A0A4R2KXA1_9GAMM|nr:M23 family metallopeptidase [Chromatocurvus halotolerans]TCO75896.1 peptidase M23-like protein [Chromatocurvus halotolerans]
MAGAIRIPRWRELLLFMGAAAATSVAHAQCVDVSGDPTQGGVIWGRVAPEARVALDGEAIDVLPNGYFVAGFGRNAAARSLLVVEQEDPGKRCEQALTVATREYRIDRVEGVPQRTVTPPPVQLERIRRERELVAAAKRQRIERPDWLLQVDGGFDWPATGRISGVYGSQRVYNGEPGNPHYGVDVAVPTGTPVLAPAAGVVTLAEDDLFYSGGTVILDHGYRLSSSFLHMSRILVSVGDELAQGDLIGEVGATGRATGPHLDWRMSWRQERVDPQLLVPPMPKP